MATQKKKAVAKKATKKSVAQKATKKTASKTTKKTATKQTVKKAAAKKTTTKATKAAPKKVAAKKTATTAKKIVAVKPEKININENTLKKLKDLLLEEREKNLLQSEELAQEAVDLIADREGGDTQFDEESGEGDSVAVERERTLFLSAEAQNTVQLIDKALERMKNKTYGICQKCGKRIGIPRLEALPWAEVCIDCKARSERRF